jgi:hypothetical protein
VDVMLLEPAIGRAVRALEPVVDFTRAGRRVDVRAVDAASDADADGTAVTTAVPVTEVARGPAEESR